MTLQIIKNRKDFISARDKGQKWVTPAFVIQINQNDTSDTRVGFTASKKVGGAVQRNKAKRRLRETIRHELKSAADQWSLTGKDIVLIARNTIIDYDFYQLGKDLQWAFRKLGLKKDNNNDT